MWIKIGINLKILWTCFTMTKCVGTFWYDLIKHSAQFENHIERHIFHNTEICFIDFLQYLSIVCHKYFVSAALILISTNKMLCYGWFWFWFCLLYFYGAPRNASTGNGTHRMSPITKNEVASHALKPSCQFTSTSPVAVPLNIHRVQDARSNSPVCGRYGITHTKENTI